MFSVQLKIKTNFKYINVFVACLHYMIQINLSSMVYVLQSNIFLHLILDFFSLSNFSNCELYLHLKHI